MKLQFFPRSSRLVRFALTGLMATQTAIATTIVSEFTLTTPGIDSTHAALAKDERLSAQDVYRKASPAVVYIETERANERISGSGVIINSNGLIVTNAHVMEGARRVTVELSDGRKFSAEIVSLGSSNCLDLALLQIQATNLPTVKFAAANSVRQGQDAFAIGYPKGVKPSSITRGGVSNVFSDRGEIQTDATLNHGNSGGALLNDRGELLGINTRGESDATQMNTAIAASEVQALVQASMQGLSPILGRFMIPATAQPNSAVSKLVLNGLKNNSTLQKSDHLMCDGSRADLHMFKGDANQPVMIDMTSSQIGSYLVLLGPNGEVVAEHQSEERRGTASILVKLPVAGVYTVIANALRPEQLGTYQLQATIPLLFEQGQFTDNTSQLDDGSPYNGYRFTGQATQTIAVDLHQFDFDPYLILLDSEGKKVIEGKADRQSRVDIELPRDGSYTLIVRTVNPSDRGRFTLSVHPSEKTTQPNAVSQNR